MGYGYAMSIKNFFTLSQHVSRWARVSMATARPGMLCHNDVPQYTTAGGKHIQGFYVPRKCSATNRIIKAKDHASVQISVGKVDENGRFTGESQVYALCGFVRAMGESDDSLNRLAQRDGLLKNVWSGSSQR